MVVAKGPHSHCVPPALSFPLPSTDQYPQLGAATSPRHGQP